jgi:hypothetical protein
MRRFLAVMTLLAAAAAARPAAHHDVATVYDEGARLTIEGQLVSLSLRNPHSFMQVAVRAGGKAEVRYTIEWNGADNLRRSGINSATFHAGDRIVLTGQPSRPVSGRGLRLTQLRRPKDGLVWAEPMS